MALNKTSIVKPDNVLRDMMKTRYEQFVEGKQYI